MARRASKPPTQRQLRVGEHLRHALSEIIKHNAFQDPDLINTNLTITEVKTSPDLRNSTVYIANLTGGKMDGIVHALNKVKPFIRYQVANKTDLRNAPDFKFQADPTFQYSENINTLLNT
jgi:ribosome-binding factor A